MKLATSIIGRRQFIDGQEGCRRRTRCRNSKSTGVRWKKIKKESSKHIRLEDSFYVIWNTIDDLECYFFRIRSGETHCW